MKIGYTQTTKEQLINNYKKLIEELGHEPTTLEIDACEYLPTARQIQRRFGGLRTLRKEMGLENIDFTSGEYRAKVAKKAHENAKRDEVEYFNALVKKHHDPDNGVWVSPQYIYHQAPTHDDYTYQSCDVCIEDRSKNHRVLIDFFSAKDEQSAGGSIRIKAKKLKKHPPSFLYPHPSYEVIFVCLNPEINTSKLPDLTAPFIKFMTLEQFNDRFLS